MPIYEYVCRGCRETFSVLKFSAADDGTTCPACGSKDVAKKISAFSCSASSGFGGYGGHGGGGG
jgi:putative FmdB family regulatory protein